MSILYIVATPIGNLGDISERAKQVLAAVDVIAAEDTRHSRQLLARFDISTRLIALHDHNEAASVRGVVELLERGDDVALISDAGTPLISDPGFALVRACREHGIAVQTVPGPSAVTAALSVAGLPTDRFTFEGFAPSRAGARDKCLQALTHEPRTMVFYEAPHRIRDFVAAIAAALGNDRRLSLCRELTKAYEQVFTDSAENVLAAIDDSTVPAKGEFVVVIAGSDQAGALEADTLLLALLTELSPSKAASVAAKLTAASRAELYDRAMQLRSDDT